MRKLYVLFITFLLMNALHYDLNAQILQKNWWVTNGRVSAIAKNGNTVYLGGDFDYVGPQNASFGIGLNPATGTPSLSIAKANNIIAFFAVADGSGGWYIAGYFTR